MPYVRSGDAAIYYEIEGSGPGLVLMHGTTGSTQEWRDGGYVDALRATHQLVLIDQRGHGKSDKPHNSKLYDWELLVDDVIAVLNDCGLDAPIVAGYSAGSFIALGLAMTHPERVSALVLGGASTQWAGASARVLEFLSQGMESFLRATLEANGPLPQRDRNRILANDPEAVAASLQGTRCLPSKEMLAQFSKPSFIFVGEQDPRLASSKEMVSWLPNAELAVVPGRDHYHTFFSSELVLPHLNRFLDTV